jgi:hypothetical protein
MIGTVTVSNQEGETIGSHRALCEANADSRCLGVAGDNLTAVERVGRPPLGVRALLRHHLVPTHLREHLQLEYRRRVVSVGALTWTQAFGYWTNVTPLWGPPFGTPKCKLVTNAESQLVVIKVESHQEEGEAFPNEVLVAVNEGADKSAGAAWQEDPVEREPANLQRPVAMPPVYFAMLNQSIPHEHAEPAGFGGHGDEEGRVEEATLYLTSYGPAVLRENAQATANQWLRECPHQGNIAYGYFWLAQGCHPLGRSQAERSTPAEAKSLVAELSGDEDDRTLTSRIKDSSCGTMRWARGLSCCVSTTRWPPLCLA